MAGAYPTVPAEFEDWSINFGFLYIYRQQDCVAEKNADWGILDHILSRARRASAESLIIDSGATLM